MVTALFKEETASQSFLNSFDPATRIVWFWIHEPARITDGHVAFETGAAPRISINMSTKGKPFDIAQRARLDGASRQDEAGLTHWNDAEVTALLADLGADSMGAAPVEAFAEAVVGPLRAEDRATAARLSILWDVDDRDIRDAISLRYQVVQKAEALLNDAGLLVDPSGTVVPDHTVAATLEVAEFEAAKTLLWNKLSPEERRYNCRIQPS
ncbi:MAG: hypothetical protein AAF222_10740 [Pseudomonadota bacterium]